MRPASKFGGTVTTSDTMGIPIKRASIFSKTASGFAEQKNAIISIKSNLQFNKTDELEFLKVVHGKKTLSKKERSYLTRYVAKGIPDHLRRHVRFPLLLIILVLDG